jgi:hypothetical protein
MVLRYPLLIMMLNFVLTCCFHIVKNKVNFHTIINACFRRESVDKHHMDIKETTHLKVSRCGHKIKYKFNMQSVET